MKSFLTYSFLVCCMGCWMATTNAQCMLSATSSGSNAGYAQVYVLVDNNGNIIAENTTGSFAGVPMGTYQIHALNYDPFNPPAPLPNSLLGQAITNVGNITPGCFNADFLTDFVLRSCGNCQQSTTTCETDPIVATSSGGNNSYTQLYALVDAATSLVVATNNTGTFTGLVTAGNSYRVYALNYDPLDAPAPLPTVGQSVNLTGTIIAGCSNADFLTDYVCFNITNCVSTCIQNNSVCQNANISASSSGNNGSYVQVYVLADDNGNFIAQNTTGIFSTASLTVGTTYRVHALNYAPVNPPSPLPSTLATAAAISTISGGCFNSDFLTDYVCYTITACIPFCIQEQNICENEDIIASSSGSNPTYTQVYVLTDDNGLFLAQNTTGIFSTLGFTLGNTYHVHALNYDPLNPPSPLPSALSVGAPISTIIGGCFNSDFLTDYVCYTIGCPCTGRLVQYAPTQATPGSNGSITYTTATAYCDDISGWRYYYDPTVPDDLLFAIEHKPLGGNSTNFTANITISVNDYSPTTGFDTPLSGQDLVNFEANFGMGRSWNVDVISGSLNGPVNVRFYYPQIEYNTTNAAAAAWRTANEPLAISSGYSGLIQLTPFWFKTIDGSAYNADNDLSPTTVNSGNILTLNPNYIGTDATVVNNNKNYVQFDNQISSFSGGTAAFRVTPITIILNNSVLKFEGEKEGKANRIYWTIDNEQGIVEYELERSQDGINYEIVYTTATKGQLDYTFLDQNPFTKTYYRLKINQSNGSSKLSQWIVLQQEESNNSQLQLYPNPTINSVQIQFIANQGNSTIKVTDLLGRIVLEKKMTTIEGQNRYALDLSSLSSAVYLLTLENGTHQVIRKITKL
jgi:hypothetical protein